MDQTVSDDKRTPAGQVEQNVDAIVALHNADHQEMSPHHRTVEKLVSTLTVPAFLFGLVGAMLLWMVVNVGLDLAGKTPWDRPPFGWMQTTVSVISLVMTSLIFITQSRQGKIASRNAQLDLQINLLVDQKSAKIIQLLEEMRVDSPYLRNRTDVEAEELQVAVDPSQVATTISDKMKEIHHENDEEETKAE